MDPTKQETPPQQTAAPAQRKPFQTPKVPLPDIDGFFVKAMDNEELSVFERLLCARLHQQNLYIQALVALRQSDLREINANFKGVTDLIKGMTGEAPAPGVQQEAPPAADPAPPAAEPPVPVPGAAAEVPAADDAPPVVPDKSARLAALQQKAADKNAAARAKKASAS